MHCYHCLIICLLLLLHGPSYGQDEKYIISKMSFSSGLYDEFSPVYFRDGIAFCSNQKDNAWVSYNGEQEGLFKIFLATRKGNAGWKYPVIFSREITSGYNDGPVTFDARGDLMYFSRNNEIEKSLRNVSDTSNKLGIYAASFIDGVWTGIKPFPYNDPQYSFCAPALTPDGKRLYFSSDMPGGIGGMDLYYCERHGNNWDQPVNMGPAINTPENESFPFAGQYGKLFFASDGHGGLGGMDLFYTQEANGKWIAPVHLDQPINSEADDFGIVTDSSYSTGYFSSNREKTDDIFSFTSAPVDFDRCDIQQENNYCYTFYDEQYTLIDTIPVRYEWDFGDGIISLGKEAKHCFPGPGKYLVQLSIFDEMTGETIVEHVSYNVKLEDIEQAYIYSYNVGLSGDTMVFDAGNSLLKNVAITDYLWDFGEGFRHGGPLMTAAFKKQGEQTVKLGLLLSDSTGVTSKVCVKKRIVIYKDCLQFEPAGDRSDEEKNIRPLSDTGSEVSLLISTGLINDLSERQKIAIRKLMIESGSNAIQFDRSGIKKVSHPFLDAVINFLKENPEIRLEMTLHTTEDGYSPDKRRTPEHLAQELTFYFRNNEVELASFGCKGFPMMQSFFHRELPSTYLEGGIVEFLFMNNMPE